MFYYEFLRFPSHHSTQMDSRLLACAMGKRHGKDEAVQLFIGTGVPKADVVIAVVDLARHGGNGNAYIQGLALGRATKDEGIR